MERSYHWTAFIAGDRAQWCIPGSGEFVLYSPQIAGLQDHFFATRLRTDWLPPRPHQRIRIAATREDQELGVCIAAAELAKHSFPQFEIVREAAVNAMTVAAANRFLEPMRFELDEAGLSTYRRAVPTGRLPLALGHERVWMTQSHPTLDVVIEMPGGLLYKFEFASTPRGELSRNHRCMERQSMTSKQPSKKEIAESVVARLVPIAKKSGTFFPPTADQPGYFEMGLPGHLVIYRPDVGTYVPATIDIWPIAGRKVFSAVCSPVQVINFKRGPWVDLVLHL